MKRILSSTIQVFRQTKSDSVMFTACFTPFVVGTLVKFGIPFLERIADFSLQAYYPISGLLLPTVVPVLLCLAFAVITLEEIDDKASRYFSVTPLGRPGYLFTRLGVPVVISVVIVFIVLLFFSLEKLSAGITVGLAFPGSTRAVIVSLIIMTSSTNKLEGTTATKLSTPVLLGIPASFSIKGMVQYTVGFLPSSWIGRTMQSNGCINLLIALPVTFVWSYVLASKLVKKLAG